MTDYPLSEMETQINEVINLGGSCYQKWTCSHCGARQTMMTPNVFYTSGKCEECEKTTEKLDEACNYMVTFGISSL